MNVVNSAQDAIVSLESRDMYSTMQRCSGYGSDCWEYGKAGTAGHPCVEHESAQ